MFRFTRFLVILFAIYLVSLSPLPAQAQNLADRTIAESVQFSRSRRVFSDSVKPFSAAVKVVGDAESSKIIEFQVALKMRDLKDLEARIANGEVISMAEMQEKYLPLASDYATLLQWLKAQGLSIKQTFDNRLTVVVEGSVSNVRQALGIPLKKVTVEGQSYIATDTAPALSETLSQFVLGINGLQPYLKARHHSEVSPNSIVSSRFTPPYSVDDILTAYNAKNLGVDGTNQKIAILADTFPSANDLTDFWNYNGVLQSLSRIEAINVQNAVLPSPSGEETLDVSWSSSIAPNSGVRIYAAGSTKLMDFDLAYQQIISDLPSQPNLHQLSISFGLCEAEYSASELNTEIQFLRTIASQGVTIFASAGDTGSAGCFSRTTQSGPLSPSVSFPASDPFVTAVGGTSLFLNTSTGAVSSEVAWNSSGVNGSSGGGLSVSFGRPSWQVGTGVPSNATTRLVPDVSLVADYDNTPAVLVFDGSVQPNGGTSLASPIWAGFAALINQARANSGKPPLGLLGPKVYPLLGTNAFRDITTGNNGAYKATLGYDLVTGIGVPVFSHLLGVLNSPAPGDFNQDGRSDLLWRNDNGTLTIWLMNGTILSGSTDPGILGTNSGWKVGGTGDFNQDGKVDILFRNDSGALALWYMNGTNVLSSAYLSPSSVTTDWKVAATSDFNSDGQVDILFRNDNGTLAVWYMNGATLSSSAYLNPSGPTTDWKVGGTGDFNSDGQVDILFRNDNGALAVWYLKGVTLSSSAAVNPSSTSTDWKVAAVGDYNIDGKPDLIFHNDANGTLAAWLMNGVNLASSTYLTPNQVADLTWRIVGPR